MCESWCSLNTTNARWQVLSAAHHKKGMKIKSVYSNVVEVLEISSVKRHALQGTARAALWKYLFQMQIFSCRLLPISQAA